MAEITPSGKLVISTSEKFFQKGDPLGRSTGSELSVEFDLEEGQSVKDVVRQFLAAKQKLDDAVLVAEYLRGAITGQQLESRRAVLKTRYQKALNGGKAEEASDGDA